VIDFFLRLAAHDKRHRGRELEHRPAIQRHEVLAVELEFHRHDRSLRSSGGLAACAS